MKLSGVYETTPPLPADTAGPFERHRIDPHRTDLHQHLASTLRESRLATFGEISDRTVFANMVRELAALHPHPDSAPTASPCCTRETGALKPVNADSPTPSSPHTRRGRACPRRRAFSCSCV